MYCKYKDVFGKVDRGMHSFKIANIAIIDVLFTVITSFVIHLLFPKYNFYFVLLVLFLLGIALHRLFCVRTTVDKLLFN